MLKWPFCVGRAERIVLARLDELTGVAFGGSIDNFVRQAGALGIENLEGPAMRPSRVDALAELARLQVVQPLANSG